MNCPSTPDLLRAALLSDAESDREREAAFDSHLLVCAACRERRRDARETAVRLEEAHAIFRGDRERGRERLMMALAATPRVESPSPVPSWRRIVMQRRVWLSGALAASLAAAAIVGWSLVQPASVQAQAVAALQAAESYRCRMTMVFPPEARPPAEQGFADRAIVHWASPGSMRIEMYSGEDLQRTAIMPFERAGLSLDHAARTFERHAATNNQATPLLALARLAEFVEDADKPLGEADIDGVTAAGYEIAMSKIDRDLPSAARVQVWLHPETRLPARVDVLDMSGPGITCRFADFEWNVATGGLFDAQPTAGFADATPPDPDVEKTTAQILTALRTFAKYNHGNYPQVRSVYGDAQRDELQRLMKIAGANVDRLAPDSELNAAVWGMAAINTLQRNNPDAAYHGLTVGADDPQAVLFRWRLATGDYRIIYGDLRSESVSAEKLRTLEGESE